MSCCNIRSQNSVLMCFLSSRLGPLKQICSRRERENASSLLLASENRFGRYRIANFLPTYFICVVTEQSLGKYSVIPEYGSAP